MNNVEYGHGDKHQQCIKNIKEGLVVQKKPVVSLNVLNESKHRTDHDKEARRVEYLHVFLPRNMRRTRSRERILLDLQVEVGRSDHEKCEEEYLNHEADDDDVLASLHGR